MTYSKEVTSQRSRKYLIPIQTHVENEEIVIYKKNSIHQKEKIGCSKGFTYKTNIVIPRTPIMAESISQVMKL